MKGLRIGIFSLKPCYSNEDRNINRTERKLEKDLKFEKEHSLAERRILC